MLRISILGFLIGSFFVNCLFHESIWAIFSITIALELLSRKTLEKELLENKPNEQS